MHVGLCTLARNRADPIATASFTTPLRLLNHSLMKDLLSTSRKKKLGWLGQIVMISLVKDFCSHFQRKQWSFTYALLFHVISPLSEWSYLESCANPCTALRILCFRIVGSPQPTATCMNIHLHCKLHSARAVPGFLQQAEHSLKQFNLLMYHVTILSPSTILSSK